MFGFFRHDDHSTGSKSTSNEQPHHNSKSPTLHRTRTASESRLDILKFESNSTRSKTQSHRNRRGSKFIYNSESSLSSSSNHKKNKQKEKVKRTRSFGRRIKKKTYRNFQMLHNNVAQQHPQKVDGGTGKNKHKHSMNIEAGVGSTSITKNSHNEKIIQQQQQQQQPQDLVVKSNSNKKNQTHSSKDTTTTEMEVLEEHNDGIEVSLELQGKQPLRRRKTSETATDVRTTSQSDDSDVDNNNNNNKDDELDSNGYTYGGADEMIDVYFPKLTMEPTLQNSKKVYKSQFSVKYSLIENKKEVLLYDNYSKDSDDYDDNNKDSLLHRISESVSNDASDEDSDDSGSGTSGDDEADSSGKVGNNDDRYLSILGSWGSPFVGAFGGEVDTAAKEQQEKQQEPRKEVKQSHRNNSKKRQGKHRVNFKKIDFKLFNKKKGSNEDLIDNENEKDKNFNDMLSVLQKYQLPEEEATLVKEEIYKLNSEINYLEKDRFHFDNELNNYMCDDDDDDGEATNNDKEEKEEKVIDPKNSEMEENKIATVTTSTGTSPNNNSIKQKNRKSKSNNTYWDVHWILNNNRNVNNNVNMTLEQRIKLQRNRGLHFTLQINNPRARDAFMTKCSKVGGTCRDRLLFSPTNTKDHHRDKQTQSTTHEFHFHTNRSGNFQQVATTTTSNTSTAAHTLRKETISLGPHNCRPGGAGETIRHVSILKGKNGTSFFLSKDYPMNYNNAEDGTSSGRIRPSSPNGHTGNHNNNLSYVWGYLPTPLYKRMKREGLDLGSRDADLIYLSSGPRGCYYCEFVTGNRWWGNAINDDRDFFTIMEEWDVYRVSFGPIITKEDENGRLALVNSWIILGKDGRTAWKNIPSRVHNMLFNRLADMPAIAEATLGPSESYFIRFLDGTTDYCLPADTAHTVHDIECNGGEVTDLSLHPDVSRDYIVRHTSSKYKCVNEKKMCIIENSATTTHDVDPSHVELDDKCALKQVAMNL